MRPSCTSPNTDKTLSSQAPSKSYFNACLPKLKFNTKQCLKLFLLKQVRLSKYTVISDFAIPLYYLYVYSCILAFFINYCESLDARLGIQNVSILTYNYDHNYGLPQPAQGLNEISFPKDKFDNNNSFKNGNFTGNDIITKKITVVNNKSKYLKDNNNLSETIVISERYDKEVFFSVDNDKNIHSIGNKTRMIGLGLVKSNKDITSDVILKTNSNKYLRKKKSTVKYKGTNTIKNDTSELNGLIHSYAGPSEILSVKKTVVENESTHSDLTRSRTYRSSSAVKRLISSRHRRPRTNKKPVLKGNSDRPRVYGSGWNSFKKFQRPEVGAQRHGVVSLLGLFELSTRRGARPDGASELAAARLAVRHVNERRLLPGYRLELLTNDTQCDPGVGVDRFFHALYTKNTTRMVMLLGSACSEVTESLAKVVPYWNIVQVSFGSTSPALSDRNEFPLFYRTVAPDSSHNPARIAFIRKFRWDTVTAFSQNEEVYSLAVNELLTELESANITCAASITFAETDFMEQLQLLKELDTRIIVGSFSSDMMPKIFCEAYRLGMYGADYVWMVQGGALPASGAAAPCTRTQLSAAMDRVILVASYNSIVRDDLPSLSGLTNQMFVKEMETVHVPLSVYAPQTYDAVWAIALALRGAEQTWRNGSRGTTEPPPPEDDVCSLSHFDYTRQDMAEDFLQQLGQLSFLGVSGPVSFSGADRVGTSAFYQIQEGEVRTVALYHPAARALDFACAPCAAPAWHDEPPVARRVRRRRLLPVAPAARAAGTALAVAGAALAGAFLAVNLHYSKLRSIKLSSPRLNNMTLVGCVLVYGAVALLGVDSATLPSFVRYSAICTGRVYLLSAGFSLAFGSMFAKTYRVHRIFISNRSGVCKTKLLQDTQLISLICALLLIDGLIVTLWVIIDPMERHLKNLTFEISKTDRSVVYQPQIEVCKSQHTAGWLSALYAYKGLLLIVGLYMAWETRHVKISALNDSKYIGISVYSVVITSISVVVLGNLISDRATLAYVTITGLILISTTSTLCLLFLPKMMSIMYKTEDEDPVVHSMGLKIECNTRRFVTDDTQELHYRVEIQNKVYKREMAVLDKEITRLEKILQDSNATTSSTSSSASIPLTSKSELTVIHENSNRKHSQDDHHRTPSISGGLPLLLLSVLPPVIPRASWPSTEACNLSMRRSVTFSSQPKLNDRPAIDLYNLCLTKKNEDNHGILSRLRNIFGSRAPSRKTSTTSISGANTGQGIAAALKLHVGMIAGLVPGASKHPMVLSCNTLDNPGSQRSLRKESLAHSGPIINIVGYETPESQKSPPEIQKRKLSKSFPFELFFKRDSQKETAEIQGHRVNFVLPKDHGRNAVSLQNSQIVSYKDRPKGSPRFPHKIVPTTSSLSALNDSRKTSSASISHISGTSNIDQSVRRSSHQPANSRVLATPTDKLTFPMGNRSKSMEDASLTLPGTRRGNGLLELSCIPSDIHPPKERCPKFAPNTDIWATAHHGIPLSEFVAEYEGNKTKFVRKQASDTSLS